MIRGLILGVCMLLFASCGTIQKIQNGVAELDKAITKLKTFADETKVDTVKLDQRLLGMEQAVRTIGGDVGKQVGDAIHGVREAVVSADTNNDRQISGYSEWWLLVTGILTFLGSWLKTLFAEKKLAAKLSNAKRDLWGAVGDVRDKLSNGGGPPGGPS